jgi:hypothetical protein
MKTGDVDLRVVEGKTEFIGHMPDFKSINTTVITSRTTLAMAPDSPVIRVVVNVISLSESMRCSIRSGDI